MNPISDNEERELLMLLQRGDKAAFTTIYDSYKERLTINLKRLLKSSELVEDALQEVFLRLWINRGKIDTDQPIKAYLYRIVENLVTDHFRKAGREKKMREFFVQAFRQQSHNDVEEWIFHKENRELLNKIIDLLPPARKRVYILCKLEEKSYEEVSQDLKISVNTVRDHIRKANIFLKEHLNNPASKYLFFLILAGFIKCL